MGPMSEPAVEERYEEEDDEGWIESQAGPGWGGEEEEELPSRPRSRFLAPLPIALIVVLIAAAGFLGGVLVQKGSEGGESAAGLPGGAGGLPSFLSEKGGEGEAGGSGSEASAGLPVGLGGSGSAVTGTVTSIKGQTVYVKESEGNVVVVKAEDGSTVSRDSNVSVEKIHPGDSVVVQGSKHGSTVKASSISATEAGVENSAAVGFPAAAEGEGGDSSVESLFGE